MYNHCIVHVVPANIIEAHSDHVLNVHLHNDHSHSTHVGGCQSQWAILTFGPHVTGHVTNKVTFSCTNNVWIVGFEYA